MKIIFLDIDGVLNTDKSRSRCGTVVGIDNDKLLRLKKIVDETNAKIVLVSTWKEHWERLQSRKIYQDELADYLDRKFKRVGLPVYDKTPSKFDCEYLSRGEGIVEYTYGRKIESFVIIDDYQFDYDRCGLTDYFVKTNQSSGLTDEKAQRAIEILNNKPL